MEENERLRNVQDELRATNNELKNSSDVPRYAHIRVSEETKTNSPALDKLLADMTKFCEKICDRLEQEDKEVMNQLQPVFQTLLDWVRITVYHRSLIGVDRMEKLERRVYKIYTTLVGDSSSLETKQHLEKLQRAVKDLFRENHDRTVAFQDRAEGLLRSIVDGLGVPNLDVGGMHEDNWEFFHLDN